MVFQFQITVIDSRLAKTESFNLTETLDRG